MSWFISENKTSVKSAIHLVECTTPSEHKVFRDTIDTYHSYIKFKHSPNRRTYWLVYESVSGNLVGALGLSSANIAVTSRDAYIGWDNKTKMRHLGKIANNSRFCLIQQNFTIKNVGSMALKQLRIVGARRWLDKYGEPLYMIETYVQPERDSELGGYKMRSAAVYKADNWIEVGMTLGYSIRNTPLKMWKKENGERGRLARENTKECLKKYAVYLGEGQNDFGYKVTDSPKKMVLVKPLVDNWKELLLS